MVQRYTVYCSDASITSEPESTTRRPFGDRPPKWRTQSHSSPDVKTTNKLLALSSVTGRRPKSSFSTRTELEQ